MVNDGDVVDELEFILGWAFEAECLGNISSFYRA